jgi:ERCC4-type nuclease
LKLESFLKNKNLIKHKLDNGTEGELIEIARQLLQRYDDYQGYQESLSSNEEILNALLCKIGKSFVERHPCVDHRELDEMIELSKDLGFEVLELKTGLADYESDPGEKLKTINIERKDDDFIPSLFNERHIYEQLNAMNKNENMVGGFLVVNKSFDDILRDMEFRSNPLPRSLLISYVGELCLIGYPPIFIPSRKDLIDVIDYIFYAYHKNPERMKRVNNVIGMRSRNVITFPGVSDKLAERMLDHFGSIKAIVNANIEELQEVKGIGKKIAEKIFELVN